MKNNKIYRLNFIGYRQGVEKVKAEIICSLKYAKKFAKRLVKSSDYDCIDIMDCLTGEVYLTNEKISYLRNGRLFSKNVLTCNNFPKN